MRMSCLTEAEYLTIRNKPGHEGSETPEVWTYIFASLHRRKSEILAIAQQKKLGWLLNTGYYTPTGKYQEMPRTKGDKKGFNHILYPI
jgi:hypothetical protein